MRAWVRNAEVTGDGDLASDEERARSLFELVGLAGESALFVGLVLSVTALMSGWLLLAIVACLVAIAVWFATDCVRTRIECDIRTRIHMEDSRRAYERCLGTDDECDLV